MNPVMLQRLLVALEGTPDVLDMLLEGIPSGDSRWDRRPYADRFTVRELVAHLVDYESVWLERIVKTRDLRDASFVRADPGQLAIDHDYAHSDPHQSLIAFRKARRQVVDVIESLAPEDWGKTATMGSPVGTVSIEYQASFIAIHDGYHTAQTAQWLRQFALKKSS